MGSPELVALMLADGRLPTGGHTQSAGLEPAVRAGLGADGARLDEVAAYARDRLRTITRVEAAVAVVARATALTECATTLTEPPTALTECATTLTEPPTALTECATTLTERATALTEVVADPKRRHRGEHFRPIEAAWAARTPSQAIRAASRRQGRAYLRLAARVWPEVLEHLQPDIEVARPVVIGVVAAVNDLTAEQTARLIGYDDAQTVVAASLKLLPVDPAEAASWLAALHQPIEDLVQAVKELKSPDDIPAYGAPLVDVFAQAHAAERMRLFHA